MGCTTPCWQSAHSATTPVTTSADNLRSIKDFHRSRCRTRCDVCLPSGHKAYLECDKGVHSREISVMCSSKVQENAVDPCQELFHLCCPTPQAFVMPGLRHKVAEEVEAQVQQQQVRNCCKDNKYNKQTSSKAGLPEGGVIGALQVSLRLKESTQHSLGQESAQ